MTVRPVKTPRERELASDAAVAFWQAAAELADAEGHGAGDPAAAAGAALVELAAMDAHAELRSILRPDPSVDPSTDDVRWTVTCFEIGDIAPAEVHEIGDACAAMGSLMSCDHDSHVAAELICMNSRGFQWVAAVRSADCIAFHLPDLGNLSAPSAADAARAVTQWRDHARLEARAVGAPNNQRAESLIDLTTLEHWNDPSSASVIRAVEGTRSMLRRLGTIAETVSAHRTSATDSRSAMETSVAALVHVQAQLHETRAELHALAEHHAASIARLENELRDLRARLDDPPNLSVVGSSSTARPRVARWSRAARHT